MSACWKAAGNAPQISTPPTSPRAGKNQHGSNVAGISGHVEIGYQRHRPGVRIDRDCSHWGFKVNLSKDTKAENLTSNNLIPALDLLASDAKFWSLPENAQSSPVTQKIRMSKYAG